MPVTPPMLRGNLYSTNLYKRCPEFHQCRRCMMCAHYDPHNALCVVCEADKAGRKVCGCTDDQQAAVIHFEEVFGRPLYEVNAKPGSVTIGETAENSQRTEIVKQLHVKEFTDG